MDKNNFTGNKNASSDFIRVILALKKNIARETYVSEVCQIQEIKEEEIIVNPINFPNQKIYCCALKDLELKNKDVVLVNFTNTDYRLNLKRIKSDQKTQEIEEKNNLHSIEYGVIVGLIYRKED